VDGLGDAETAPAKTTCAQAVFATNSAFRADILSFFVKTGVYFRFCAGFVFTFEARRVK